MKSFLIIGMGNFGHHLCRELSQQKCEVMVVDSRADAVEDVLPLVVSAKVGDCTKEEVLHSFGVEEFDCCFVCVSSNFKNSLQITSLLKELGAKRVICKANDDIHSKFLLRNGADQVIYPEKEAAVSLAVSESSDDIFDCIHLTQDYSIYEIVVPSKWVGKNLRQLEVRRKYNLDILAVKTGENILPLPAADRNFSANEHLMILAHVDDLRNLLK